MSEMEKTWDIVTLNGIDYVKVEEKVRTAIKLQELVKQKIVEKEQLEIESGCHVYALEELQSLIKESKK